MVRSKYSPYEGDWWEWVVTNQCDNQVYIKPLIQQVSDTCGLRTPSISSQTEVAKNISNAIATTPGSWQWATVPYKDKG